MRENSRVPAVCLVSEWFMTDRRPFGGRTAEVLEAAERVAASELAHLLGVRFGDWPVLCDGGDLQLRDCLTQLGSQGCVLPRTPELAAVCREPHPETIFVVFRHRDARGARTRDQEYLALLILPEPQ